MSCQIFDYRNVAADVPPTHWSNTLVRSKGCSRLSNIELDKEFATILVGEEQHVFNVRRALLTHSSDFFKRALNGDFIERRGLVRLSDGNAEAFSLYIAWLTTTKLVLKMDESEWKKSHLRLRDCLVLADILQDDNFYNSAVDVIIHDMNVKGRCPSSLAEHFYDGLPESSPVIKLFIDIWAYGATLEWWKSDEGLDTETAPKEFWCAVAKEMVKIKRGGEPIRDFPWKINRCRYHKHDRDKSC